MPDTEQEPARTQTALVVEGGGMRAAFSSGVTDAFLQAEFNPFTLLVGVSSGASTIASYLAGQEGRNLAVLLDQSCRPEFIRWSRFIRGGDLMDIDWLWRVVQQENPLDCERMFAQQRDFRIVLSNAVSGLPQYAVAQPESFLDVLRASSSIPFIIRKPVQIGSECYYDGGVADALPVQWALAQPNIGRVVVIRTRTYDYIKNGGLSDALLARHLPAGGFAQALRQRVKHYNATLAWMRQPENCRYIIEINPPNDSKMAGRLCRDAGRLRYSYAAGLECGRALLQRWPQN
ncbi:patatin-like phospholipase family protein [Snodgrassella alvi]|uniref:patatin-like phospholipase family protein n=1 Tax=Snodgrassella alvi TaxID=1196083 RepID=UPI000C1F835B|nr:patatin family protein [Snodgrassella alvi]PIT18718.1 patatin family protein [Snodgrassella alvi]